jgi:hypothetical protein
MPQSALETARGYLMEAGRQGREAFVLFSGAVSPPTAIIRSVVYPPQKAVSDSSGGVGVYVTGQSLFEITRWAARRTEILLGQIHTHPGRAFHSRTDDAYPLVSLPGAFSVVVPNFCRVPIDLSQCACYRCTGGKWIPASPVQIFKVV